MTTFVEVDLREELLNVKGECFPGVQRAVERAKALDLRTITDPARRLQVQQIRVHGTALLATLKKVT